MKKYLLKLTMMVPVLVLLTGCETLSSRFLPQQIAKQTPILLKTANPELNGLNVPSGSHLIPNSGFVVLDDKPVDMVITGVAAGAGGVLIHHYLEAEGQKKRLNGTENLYQIGLKSLLDEAMQAQITQHPRFKLAQEGDTLGKNSILLHVRVFIGTTKDDFARLHTILETKAPVNGDAKWRNRYIYYSTQWLPFTGPQSWAEGGRELITSEVRLGITETLSFFLGDIFGTKPKTQNFSQITAKYMGTSESKTIKNAIVVEKSDDRTIVQVQKTNEITSDGIHFLPSVEVADPNN